MNKCYSEYTKEEIKKLECDLKSANFLLNINSCPWFFPNLQKIICVNTEAMEKGLSFKIIMGADDEVSALRYLAAFLFWRFNLNNRNDRVVFSVKNDENEDDLIRAYEKVSRFFALFSDKYGAEKILIFEKMPQYTNEFLNKGQIEAGQLWPYERGGFGRRGMPLIPLDKEVYFYLQKNFFEFIREEKSDGNQTQSWKSISEAKHKSLTFVAMREICKYFTERFQAIKESRTYNINSDLLKILNHADVLTFIIFSAAFFGIYNPNEGRRTLKERIRILKEDSLFITFYERCCAYSLGILQLIENTINYTSGGFLSIRIIRRNDKYLKRVLSCPDDNNDDFIAISVCDVADLLDGSCMNMTGKFLRTLKLRKDEPSVNELLSSPSIDKVVLKDLFFPTDNDPLLKYLRAPVNTGYHYGLQIFASAVASAKGNFTVVSGDYSKLECTVLSENTESKAIKNRYASSDESLHIYYCGTIYDILLPINGVLDNEGEEKFPIPEELSYEALPDNEPLVISINCEEYWEKIKLEIDKKENILSEFKQQMVKMLSNQISYKIGGHVLAYDLEPLVICFDDKLRASSVLNLFMEIMAKAIFILLSNESFKYRNIVLSGFSDNKHLTAFMRYYAQFYDRFGYNGSFAAKSQIMLIMNDENKSKYTVLSGRYIGKPLYEYKMFSGGEDDIVENKHLKLALDSISARTTQRNYEVINYSNNPHCFDNINLEVNNQQIKHWILDLDDALKTNFSNHIHVGSKINNCVTHMHVSGVHIDTFYQVDHIFTNAYWAVKLGQWVWEKIRHISGNNKIVLFGYGHLVEPMLLNVKQQRSDELEYIIYEEGYHYTAEKVSQPDLSFSCSKQTVADMIKDGATVVFVMPISTTLSTFNRMGDKLFSEFCCDRDEPNMNNVEFIAVFQIVPEDDNSRNVSKQFFLDDKNGIVTSVNSIINEKFSSKKDCTYLLSFPAKWQEPDKCSFCYPKSGQCERMLFTTDDTSLVPTMQLQDFDRTAKKSGNLLKPLDFFEKENGRYIYSSALVYNHIERQDVHFAHYIQTKILLNTILENKRFDDYAKKIKDTLFIGKNHKINIIIAPSHTSNQKFPVKVNEMLFDGKAHIISVNAKKIYRSNFEAEYSNYSSLIETIICGTGNIKPNSKKLSDYVGFYYVDDHINSGATFLRMRSLVKSLFRCTTDTNTEFNFDAVITLIDRHSNSSLKDYINDSKRFISFFKFNVPAVRSNGDSCPLCKRVSDDKKLELCAALDETANICAERRNAHNVKEISRFKLDYDNLRKTNGCNLDVLSQRHMRRFEVENILWNVIRRTESYCYRSDDPKGCNFWSQLQNNIIETVIEKVNSSDTDDDKIEYLISFVKVLPRPFLSFRPFVATVAIDIFRDICNCMLQNKFWKKGKIKITFNYKEISQDGNLKVNRQDKIEVSLSDEIKYGLINLLIVCLSGLSGLNSTYILDTEKIKGILKFYEKANCGVDMYDSFPGVKDSEKDKRSFADYVRFSVFQLVHHEKFGDARRQKFDDCLEYVLNDSSSMDYNTKQLFSLLYMENGTPDQNMSEALEILHDEIINDNFGNNKIECLSIKSDIELAESIAYINENELMQENSGESGLILTPITTRGYCDAYDVGFDLHFLNNIDCHYPIIESLNRETNQLWGKILLSDEAVRSLDKFGISIFNSAEVETKNAYIFFKFSNKPALSARSSENNNDDIMFPMSSLYLRIKVQQDMSYLDLLKSIRAIISQRTMILKKFAADLTTEDINRLIAERRFNRALSITKASKHATEEAERTLNYKLVDNLGDRLVGQIRRLLSNRTISTLYQVESMMFEKENRDINITAEANSKAPYNDSDEIGGCSKLKLWAENDGDDKYTQIWNMMKSNDFYIYGTKDANTSHNIKLKFDIDSSVKPSTYSYSLKYNALQEKKLMLDIVFLLANNAIRHLSEEYDKDTLPFKIKQEGSYIVVSSPTGKNNVEQDIIKTARSMVIPPHVRKYFIDRNNRADSETDGITLWSLARYFGRLDMHINRKENSVSTSAIIPVKKEGNNAVVGFEYFNISFSEIENGYEFAVKLKCLES